MTRIPRAHFAAALITFLLLGMLPGQSSALRGYGEDVDAFCLTYDGSTPFADLGGNTNNRGCLLCHTSTSGSGRVQPGYDAYRTGDYRPICTGSIATPNRAPDGTITSPSSDRTILAGQTLPFQGSGSDPDGDTLTFIWSFPGVTTNRAGPGPHDVAFPNPGVFTARLTVSDGQLDDPTPAIRTITGV